MNEYFLSHGKHVSREEGLCAMEWVAYLAGEPHSDGPRCVSPMLRTFCIHLNDRLPDGERQRLRPYLARTIGTSGDGLDGQRERLCADWLIRECTSAWLGLTPSLEPDASALRALPVLSPESVEGALACLGRACTNATAAGDAAVALNAVRTAAWVAARIVKVTAETAGGAASDVAWTAVGDAVGNGGRDALAPTVSELQDSVLRPGGLLDRLLPTELIQIPVVGDWREVCDIA